MDQQYGPKVLIKYQCNGCKFLDVVNFEDETEPGLKCLACTHPTLVAKYQCPQYLEARIEKTVTLNTIADTPSWCPYRK
jgi:hypothetical protein